MSKKKITQLTLDSVSFSCTTCSICKKQAILSTDEVLYQIMNTLSVYFFLTCITHEYFGKLESGENNNKNSSQSPSNILGFVWRD
jgi:hypothetical protein